MCHSEEVVRGVCVCVGYRNGSSGACVRAFMHVRRVYYLALRCKPLPRLKTASGETTRSVRRGLFPLPNT